jgi:hypothetical protein
MTCPVTVNSLSCTANGRRFGNELLANIGLILIAYVPTAQSANGQAPPVAADAQLQTDAQKPMLANAASSKPDAAEWHFELSPYIWFAGTHGTVGALGRTASVHASPTDLLFHFNFGIMA